MSKEIVQLNEEVIKGQLKDLVRGSKVSSATISELNKSEISLSNRSVPCPLPSENEKVLSS